MVVEYLELFEPVTDGMSVPECKCYLEKSLSLFVLEYIDNN